jgi:hypothetical protein
LHATSIVDFKSFWLNHFKTNRANLKPVWFHAGSFVNVSSL